MAREIKFNISADVDMKELKELTKSLGDIGKGLEKLDGLNPELIKPSRLRDIRNMDEALSDLTKKTTKWEAANVRTMEKAASMGKQLEIAYGRMGKSTLQATRNLEETETALKFIQQDISKIDQVTRKFKLFPDSQKKAAEDAAKAMDKVRTAQDKLNKLQESGKSNSDAYKQGIKELGQATKELDRASSYIDKLDAEFGDMNRTVHMAEASVKKMKAQLKDAGIDDEDIAQRFHGIDVALKSARNVMGAFNKETIELQSRLSRNADMFRETSAAAGKYTDELTRASKEAERLIRSTTRDVGARGQLSSATKAVSTQRNEYAKLSNTIRNTEASANGLTSIQRELNGIMQRGTVSIREHTLMTANLARAKRDLHESQSRLKSQDTRLDGQMVQYAEAIDKARNSLRQLGTMGSQMARGSSEWTANRLEMEKARDSIIELETASNLLARNQSKTKAALREVGLEIERLDRTSADWKQGLQEIKSMRSVWEAMLSPIKDVLNVSKQLANMFGKTVTAAINTAVRAMRGISGAAGSIFSGLQRALQGTGGAFNKFGTAVQNSMNKAKDSMLAVTAAGYALMSIGSQMQMFGNMTFRRMSGQLGEYMDYERTRIQAAIAATEFDPDTKTMNVDNTLLDRIIFSMQSGRPGVNSQGEQVSYLPTWMTEQNGGKPIPVTFNAQDLAQGMYYYSAAIGQPITADNAEVLMPTISTIMQMAKVSNTELESAIKGVMNIAMEFGYDPRSLAAQDQLDIQRITAQVGYLANISTMEVQDIVEMFKMVGPMANQVAGGTRGAGLTDTMLLALMASEVGLRGGNVGRGVQQLFTSLLDPTNKMLSVMGKYFNEGEAFSKDDFKDYFFENGALKNWGDAPQEQGILGFFGKLAEKGLKGADMSAMIAEMFTNNATRSAIGPILGLDKDKIAGMDWEDFFAGWDEDPLRWLAQAAAETADSVSGWFDYMKNAWFQFSAAIINSIKGPLTGGFRVIGELLYEIASLINDTPAIGRFLSGLVGTISALASIGGTAVIASGALMILSRTILSLGGGFSMFIKFLTLGALSLGLVIPAILALGLAMGIVSKLWQKDVLGMRTKWEEFTEGMSGKNVGTMFDGLSVGIERLAKTFDDFLEGVIFGNRKSLDNFAAWMYDLLGANFTALIIGQLEKVHPALRRFGNGLDALVPSYKEGVANLDDYQKAFRGFWEQVVFGSMSVDAAKSISDLGSAFGMAPGELRKSINDAAQTLRSFVAYVMNAASIIYGVWKDISVKIYDNLASAFDIKSFSDVIERIKALVEGILIGFTTAIAVVLSGIERLTAGIASMAARFRSAGVDTERLANIFRMLGIAIGAVLGARFALAFAPIMGAVKFLIPSLLTITGLFVGLAGKLLVVAANAAIFVAQMVLMAAQFVIVKTAVAVFSLLQFAMTGLAAATSFASASMLSLVSLSLGLMGLTAIIGGIVYAVIGLTQGFDVANRIARNFINGLIKGFMPFARILVTIVAVVGAVIKTMLMLIDTFTGASSSAETLGMILGAVFGAILLKAIVGLIASVFSLILAIGGVPLAGVAAGFILVSVFNEWTGILGGVVSVLAEVVGWLNKVEIAGVGAGNGLLATGLLAAKSPLARTIIAGGARAVFANPVAAAALGGLYGYKKLNDSRNNQIDSMYGTSNRNQQISMGASADAFSNDIQALTSASNPNNVYSGRFNEAEGYNYLVMAQIASLQRGNAPLPGVDWSYENGQGNWDTALSPEATRWMETQNRVNGIVGMVSPFNTGKSSKRPTRVAGASKAVKEQGSEGAQGYVDGFIGWLKSNGSYDMVDGIATGLGFDLDNLSFSDFTSFYKQLTSVPEMDSLFNEYDMLSYMPNGKEYKKAIDDYTQFNNLVEDLMKTHGYTQAEAIQEAKQLYESWGIKIPVDPGTYDEFNEQQNQFLNDVEEGRKKFEEESQKWAEAAKSWGGMSAPEMFGALYDPLAGQGNQSLISWLSGTGWEAISKNIPEGSAPWMNQTEFLADFALGGGMSSAGEGIYGQNLHTLLKNSGALDALSAQIGVPIDVLLQGVPKFQAPEEFQGAAMNDMVNIIGSLPKDVAGFLDKSFGTDLILSSGETATKFGMDWAEMNQFAIGKAIQGQDWNLVDYMTESWGVSIQEANDYLKANGIDPNAISEATYGTVKDAVLSNQGAYNVLTEDMYNWIATATDNFSTNIISMTESEFRDMDDATKLILTRMGYTFVVNDYVPSEAIDKARADLDELSTSITEGVRAAEAAGNTWTNTEFPSPDLDMDGTIADWTLFSTYIDEKTGETMAVLQDLDGTQVAIPAAEYEAYQKSLEEVQRVTTQFLTNFWENWRNNTPEFNNLLSMGQGSIGETSMDYNAAGAAGALPGGYGNMALGVPPEIKTKVTLEIADIPDAKLSEAIGIPLTDGAGSIKVNLTTEGFSEAMDAATALKDTIAEISGTAVDIKVNFAMPDTTPTAGPPAPGGSGGFGGITLPVTADISSAVTAISTYTTALATTPTALLVTMSGHLGVVINLGMVKNAANNIDKTFTVIAAITNHLGVLANIGSIQAAANALAGTYNIHISVTGGALGTIWGIQTALALLPNQKTISIYARPVGNFSGAATGGQIGSAGMLGRGGLSFGDNGLIGRYAGIVGRATGGRILPGELTLVGENGPELVGLSTGSYVMTAHQTEKLFRESQQGEGNPVLLAAASQSGSEVSVSNDNRAEYNFYGDMHFGTEASAKAFFEEVDRRTGKEHDMARRGMRPVSERIM